MAEKEITKQTNKKINIEIIIFDHNDKDWLQGKVAEILRSHAVWLDKNKGVPPEHEYMINENTYIKYEVFNLTEGE